MVKAILLLRDDGNTYVAQITVNISSQVLNFGKRDVIYTWWTEAKTCLEEEIQK